MQDLLNNERGMTLISTLIGLAVIMTVLPLLSFILTTFAEPRIYDDLKTSQFFHVLHDEILRSLETSVTEDKLLLKKANGDTAVLSIYQNTIRRQVNHLGHEIYLRDVKSLDVSHYHDYVIVRVSLIKGDVYEKKIPLY